MRSSVVASLLAVAGVVGCAVELDAGRVERCALGVHSPGPLAETEALIGRRFDIDRRFHYWDDPIPDASERTSTAEGRIVLTSWRTRLTTNEIIRWARVADGSDPRITAQLTAVAGRMRDLGDRILVIYHDEANDDAQYYGTPAEYVLAWQYVVQAFRDAGASNVEWVWSLSSSAYPELADAFYPGNEWVDWIGVTGFNWYTGDAVSSWRTFAGVFASFVEWARPHGKPLIIVNTASGENPMVDVDDPRSKPTWIRQAIESVTGTPEIQALVWYDDASGVDAYRDWRVDSSPATLAAFRELAAAPHFDVTAATAP